jgi:hypothetical protein
VHLRVECISGVGIAFTDRFFSNQACAAAALSGNSLSIATALESDLEPYWKLRRYELKNVSLAIIYIFVPAPHRHQSLSPARFIMRKLNSAVFVRGYPYFSRLPRGIVAVQFTAACFQCALVESIELYSR